MPLIKTNFRQILTVGFGILLTYLISTPSHAKNSTPHSKATLIVDETFPESGSRVGVFVELDKHWHTYWENSGESGSPSQIDFESSATLLPTSTQFQAPQRIVEQNLITFGYQGETLFAKTLHYDTTPSSKDTLTVRIQYLVCMDICVPASASWSYDFSKASWDVHRNPSIFKKFQFPIDEDDISFEVEESPSQTLLTIFHPEGLSIIDFFPSSSMPSDFIRPSQFREGPRQSQFRFEKKLKDHQGQAIQGLITYRHRGKVESSYLHKSSSIADGSPSSSSEKAHWIWMLALAFLGGLILNLMPCVFPVLSIKLIHLVEQGTSDAKNIRTSNLFYSLGVISTFLGLAALLIALRGLGLQLGWGFQLQSLGFVYALALIFFLIAVNLLGYFEFRMPALSGADRGTGPWKDFLVGVLTTVVASPCTAPFMGVAIGFALSQSWWIILLIFLFLGLGLSLPYLMFSFFPQAASYLPKPGSWMERLREIMAFPMLCTCVWLVWLIGKLGGLHAMALSLVALILVIWILWICKHTQNHKRLGGVGILASVVVLGIVSENIVSSIPDPSQAAKPSAASTEGGIAWEPFSPQRLEQALAQGETVFVDFTADWCLTCKANEKWVLSDEEIAKAFREKKVLALKADWTHQNPEITQILASFDRAGVPFYLLYRPTLTSPLILPTLLTKGSVLKALESS
ncbi:MAG: thioredoxin family protein [Bdellovibrionota bacterium]